jgi:hypothetical protein
MLYNKDFKEEFLNEKKVIESTKKFYRYIFEIASKTEESLGKDIYSFYPTECDALITSFPCRSEGAISGIVSCFRTYMDFCIKCNAADFNYFANIIGSEAFRRYLDKNAEKSMYMSRDELTEMQQFIENAQDAVITELAFVGIFGEKAEEILNLTKDNINPNKIILPNREILITDTTYEIIENAINQKEYSIANGESSGSMVIKVINDSEYVLRPSGRSKFGQLGYVALLGRLNRIKQYWDNPYINLTSLWTSGQIHTGKQIKAQNGELTKDDYMNICNIYGENPERWHVIKSRIEKYI